MKPGPGTPGGGTPLWRSFGHAWDGLADAAATQRNMRIHLVAGVLAGSFAALAPLTPPERALLVLCVALVVAAEAANTALEALVDLHGGPPSEPARLAKDASAGAVLALAASSVLVFLVVGVRHARELIEGWRALFAPGLAGLGLAAATAAALWLPRGDPARASGGAPGRDRAAAPLAGAGVILVTLLALRASCPACAAAPAALLAVALTARNRRSPRHGG